MSEVLVYTRSGCPACGATQRRLRRRRVGFRVIDVESDPRVVDMLRAKGHMALPVVVAGSESWSGYQPARVDALAREERVHERAVDRVEAPKRTVGRSR